MGLVFRKKVSLCVTHRQNGVGRHINYQLEFENGWLHFQCRRYANYSMIARTERFDD